MNLVDPTLKDRISPAVRSDAAAWLARLHGPDRTRRVERGFKRWLAANPSHALAFELVTDAWDRAGLVRRTTPPQAARARWLQPKRLAFSAAAVVVLAVTAGYPYLQRDSFSTEVGEQRILTLEDGSRVYLNTATRARILYDHRMRRVVLNEGEALFEVAHEPLRPFVVVAGERNVQALGTSFVVRRNGAHLVVTLVDGKVRVSEHPMEETERASSDSYNGQGRVLEPGQRVTFDKGTAPRLDTPQLDKVVAWRQGQVGLENMQLGQAIEEMNRYSTLTLSAEFPESTKMHVSGVFQAGDSLNFAQAVARTYKLGVEKRGRNIILTGMPVLPGQDTQKDAQN